ncbi:MAG: sigma-54-dependent Fis family transcriptional regulator [Deltaproteobacteria bacterium]|nr:sigma-54-dependent Fis family transcriptional regulator [Deltaproteobacteria bacterium]
METAKPKVLVIDDGISYAKVIADRMPEFDLVRPAGDKGAPCLQDGPEAIEYLERSAGDVDVVLLDMHFDVPENRLLPLAEGASTRRTKRFQGVAILREIRARFPQLPVVLLTAVEDLSLVDAAEELASQSMTYLLDGEDLDALRIRINAALQEAALGVEESQILWGADPSMRAIRRRLAVLARGKLPVILEGDTGTGKSFLAERFVHTNSGRPGPFVVLDLSALPADLIPAHMFGAVRGAYTGAVADRKGVFELAHRGTLFIDEIQNVPLEVQRQLLVVLQDGRLRPLGSTKEIEVDVKVVAASNQPLDEAVAEGRFRPDLYMRLSPATRVRIPSLVGRPADLVFLARRFAEQAVGDADNAELRDEVAAACGLEPGAPVELVVGRGGGAAGALEVVLPSPAWRVLESHSWPGNMRELMMVMYNIVTFTLVATVDAIRSGLPISSPRLQVDPGLVGQLIAGSVALTAAAERERGASGDEVAVRVEAAQTLNAVANSVERQYFLTLYRRHSGDFHKMADALLGDPKKGRAVRLRFNQLGLKVRELARQ